MVARNDYNEQENPTTFGISPEGLAKILIIGLEPKPRTFKEFFRLTGRQIPSSTDDSSLGRDYAIIDALYTSCVSCTEKPRVILEDEADMFAKALYNTHPVNVQDELNLSPEELGMYIDVGMRISSEILNIHLNSIFAQTKK